MVLTEFMRSVGCTRFFLLFRRKYLHHIVFWSYLVGISLSIRYIRIGIFTIVFILFIFVLVFLFFLFIRVFFS
ncbi:uncharacterized protein RJT21DRAFT_118486 [Scheffersomyces amazonensis]|uniref:uncharacterized protein n=1 Tax=Scheffersomyces amazonensis TaxID=1078765 RepID=UPI00315DFF1E